MFENKWIADGDLSANAFIHCIDVCLVDTHTFLGQLRGIVDGNVMKFWVLAPVFIWLTKTEADLAEIFDYQQGETQFTKLGVKLQFTSQFTLHIYLYTGRGLEKNEAE